MKKLVFPAALAMFALIACPANAAPFETLGGPIGGGSNAASTLGLNIFGLGGLLNVTIAPTTITGTADAAVALDGGDNGTAQIFSSAFVLDDVAGSANTILGVVNFSLVGVGFSLDFGPSAVSGGAFTIDSATAGALSLNQGQIDITGVLTESINLGTDPITLTFADLGTNTLLGTADDDLTGNDTTVPGDEININWNGASTSFLVDVLGSPQNIVVTLQGAGLSIGAVIIPEPTSGLFLASLAAGACGVVRRRRS